MGARHSRDVPRHRLGTPAISDEVGGHAADHPGPRYEELHEIVFTALGTLTPEIGLVATDPDQGRTANEGGTAVADEIQQKQSQVDLALDGPVHCAVNHAALAVDAAAEGVDVAHLRPASAHGFHLAGDLLGVPQVVGVDRSDESAAARGDAGVAGGRHARMRQSEQADATVLGGVALHDGTGPIGRPVIDDDDLQMRIGLVTDALKRLVERRLGIVGRNNDGYQGLGTRQIANQYLTLLPELCWGPDAKSKRGARERSRTNAVFRCWPDARDRFHKFPRHGAAALVVGLGVASAIFEGILCLPSSSRWPGSRPARAWTPPFR